MYIDYRDYNVVIIHKFLACSGDKASCTFSFSTHHNRGMSDLMGDDRPLLVIGIGIPASGKTTILKGMAGIGSLYLCPDDLRFCINGDANDQSNMSIVWAMINAGIRSGLTRNLSVVLDATNYRRCERVKLIEQYGNLAKVVGLWVQTSYEVCCQ